MVMVCNNGEIKSAMHGRKRSNKNQGMSFFETSIEIWLGQEPHPNQTRAFLKSLNQGASPSRWLPDQVC